VNRQFLPGLEIEIKDFKIRRVVHQQFFERFVGKIVFRVKIELFHGDLRNICQGPA
jgi:hypothetical protein